MQFRRCTGSSGPIKHWKWGHTAESELRATAINGVKTTVTRGDFAALDALERDYRGEHGTAPSGASELELFHAAFDAEVGKGIAAGNCDGGASDLLQRWEHAAPRSPVRIIAAAKLLDRRAWCHRGNATADEVPAGAWQPYHDNVAAALSVLEHGRSTASVDPELYVVMEDLYIDQERPQAE